MACITQFAPPMAMATTPLARLVRYEESPSWPLLGNNSRTPLRMSWVVVTDGSGHSELVMQWEPAA